MVSTNTKFLAMLPLAGASYLVLKCPCDRLVACQKNLYWGLILLAAITPLIL